MKSKLFTIVLTLASFCMSTQVSAQLLFEETFDYVAGSRVVDTLESINATTEWSNFYDRADYFYVTEDSLVYPGYVLSGQDKGMWMSKENGQEIQKPFTESITDGTFYFSFMVRPTSGSSKGSVILRLLDSSNGIQSQYRAKRNDANNSILFSLDTTYSEIECAYNETHLLVFKYTFAGVDGSVEDSVALFINPSLAAEPTTADLKVFDTYEKSSEISAIRLRCRADGMRGTIDGIAVSKTWDELVQSVSSDIVELASVSADTSSVSYEDLQFDLVDGTDDIYVAHDSIAYGTNDVTITAVTVAPAASISYTKQIVNPAAGESDTAIWVVTAADGTTTKTYKAVIARSEFNCKVGILSSGSGVKPQGWSTEGWTYASASKGNGGLYPGTCIIRTKANGSITSPKFSQIGTLSFSAKFSKSDYTESLIIQKSTDDGDTWIGVDTCFAIAGGGEIPSYGGESKNDTLARYSVDIDAQDVMIRFQQAGASNNHRTAIDDIACKATDYDNGVATGLVESAASDLDFNIYPNPASGYIRIEGNVTQVSIYSLSGKVVKQTTQVEMIDINDLQSGIYLVKAGNHMKQLIVR